MSILCAINQKKKKNVGNYNTHSKSIGKNFRMYQGKAFFEDGAIYQKDEVRLMKEIPDQSKKFVHDVKEMFKGTIVQVEKTL